MSKGTLHPEVRKYFQKLGRKRVEQIKEQEGNDYFKRIASLPRNKRSPKKNSYEDIGLRFGVTRQRAHEIVKTYSDEYGIKVDDFNTAGEWRLAVVSRFFELKEATQE